MFSAFDDFKTHYSNTSTSLKLIRVVVFEAAIVDIFKCVIPTLEGKQTPFQICLCHKNNYRTVERLFSHVLKNKRIQLLLCFFNISVSVCTFDTRVRINKRSRYFIF